MTVTAMRISRPNASLSASSSWPRRRPSTWPRVKSLGTATMAVLSWTVTGSLVRSQARWFGWSSVTTRGHTEARSGCRGLSTGRSAQSADSGEAGSRPPSSVGPGCSG